MSYNYQAQKPGEGNLGSKEHLMDLDNSLIPSKQQLQSQNDIVISRNPSNSFSGANPDSSVMETSSSDVCVCVCVCVCGCVCVYVCVCVLYNCAYY